jgi:hypothetical protein
MQITLKHIRSGLREHPGALALVRLMNKGTAGSDESEGLLLILRALHGGERHPITMDVIVKTLSVCDFIELIKVLKLCRDIWHGPGLELQDAFCDRRVFRQLIGVSD